MTQKMIAKVAPHGLKVTQAADIKQRSIHLKADAVVVGSRLIEAIEAGPDHAERVAAALVASLRQAIDAVAGVEERDQR